MLTCTDKSAPVNITLLFDIMAHDLTLYSDSTRPVSTTSASHYITIGRSGENTVQLRDPKVSRFHCRIEKTTDGIVLHDLNSKNGSHLNGRQCRRAVLQSGDILQLGDSVIRLTPSDHEQTQDFHEQTVTIQTRRNPPLLSHSRVDSHSQKRRKAQCFSGTLTSVPAWIRLLIQTTTECSKTRKPIYLASGGFVVITAALVIFQFAKPDNLDAGSRPIVTGVGVEQSAHADTLRSVNTETVTENDRQQSLELAREANIILSSGEFSKAAELFKQALEMDPNNILAEDGLKEANGQVDRLAGIYFEKGEAALRTLNYSLAIKEFESVTLLLKDRRDHELLNKADKQLRHAKQKTAN